MLHWSQAIVILECNTVLLCQQQQHCCMQRRTPGCLCNVVCSDPDDLGLTGKRVCRLRWEARMYG